MKFDDIIQNAVGHLSQLPGHLFDVISVSKPNSIENAVNLSRIISKLSPMIGNLIEINTVEFLNQKNDFEKYGKWKRQDPGFPDTIFEGTVKPTPGFEIKAWFPLATEITARFKDSQKHFMENNTHLAILAWLPEFIIYGRPKIIDIEVFTCASIAKSRDTHYHNPPDYIVLEPEDTTLRTVNLQQTNTNGFKFQGTEADFKKAVSFVKSWGKDGAIYSSDIAYQQKIRRLLERYKYRLDTNYAKMDRIVHSGIEAFKNRVYNRKVFDKTILSINNLLSRGAEKEIEGFLSEHLQIAKKA